MLVYMFVCMYSVSMCRDIGRAAAHAPLATVSPATLVRRRVETPVRPCRRLFTALNPVPFPCKAEGDVEGREVCCQFTCQRQETYGQCTQVFNMGDFALSPLVVTECVKQCSLSAVHIYILAYLEVYKRHT